MAQWLIFIFCGVVWGSSFYWIKVALEEIGPVTLVAFRLMFAVLGLAAIHGFRRKAPPRDFGTVVRLLLLSLISPAIPFVLISWGETRIDSGVASVLNGMVPLLTIITAHFLTTDERITWRRLLGLLTGFSGILVLFARDLETSRVTTNFAGQGAVLLAAVLYSLSAIYSKNLLRKMSPLTITFGQMFFADVFVWALVPAFEWPLVVPRQFLTWIALAWMGLLGSCLSFLLYHRLVIHWGATRSSATNYLVPLVGLIMGLWLRHERADWHLLAGSALILCGIVVVNQRRWSRFLRK